MSYIASALETRYGGDKLVVLVAQTNAGSFTYDGIELGAERVIKEIEEKLAELTDGGCHIRKLSMVGYSLGGLVARYVCGLLYSRGWFEKIRPVNFTTFASPHLGVRTPLAGYGNHLRNVLGARTLCMSGRQLFMIDQFRDTGRPLLSVLADPGSIFIHALKQFEHRSLYANVVNDRSAPFYTTAISAIDPYTQMDNIDLHYSQGYEPVILDPDRPVSLRGEQGSRSVYHRFLGTSRTLVKSLPVYVALAVLLPVGFVAYLANSGIQSIRSQRRIKLHEDTYERHGFGIYRFPLFVKDVQHAVEHAYENVNAARGPEYLPESDPTHLAETKQQSESLSPDTFSEQSSSSLALEKSNSHTSVYRTSSDFPTLALTPAQFDIIEALDGCGFRKIPVYITKSSHSHAAIVVRRAWTRFDEGKTVIHHWLNEIFQI